LYPSTGEARQKVLETGLRSYVLSRIPGRKDAKEKSQAGEEIAEPKDSFLVYFVRKRTIFTVLGTETYIHLQLDLMHRDSCEGAYLENEMVEQQEQMGSRFFGDPLSG
jgi:hypothetical protein